MKIYIEKWFFIHHKTKRLENRILQNLVHPACFLFSCIMLLVLISVQAKAITFKVQNVRQATTPLPTVSKEDILSDITPTILPGKIRESPSGWHDSRFNNTNLTYPSTRDGQCSCSFTSAMMCAYEQHRPVVITPDTVWATILLGVCRHFNVNPEEYRHFLVSHKGQMELIDTSMEITPGVLTKRFCDLIDRNVTDHELVKVVTKPFSTTTPDDQIASRLILMSTVQEYFSFVYTRSGIPEITLEGTPEDWKDLRNRANFFRKFDLEWWLNALDPVLNQFVRTAQRKIKTVFWQGMVKYYPPGSESGAVPQNNGWLINFHPYINSESSPRGKYIKNPYFVQGDLLSATTYKHVNYPPYVLPNSITSVPIIIGDYKYIFFSGVMVSQQQGLTLKPIVSWAAYKGKEESEIASQRRPSSMNSHQPIHTPPPAEKNSQLQPLLGNGSSPRQRRCAHIACCFTCCHPNTKD